jgi:uncharacterized protein (TIRG00374 family)
VLADRIERAIERHADTPGEIQRGSPGPPRRRLVRTVAWVVVTGVSLYLVFPTLLDVFGSWRQIGEFSAVALAAMAGLQLGVLACLWALQHMALRATRWRPVITSQLAGNALSKVAPGGGALGAALQYRLLVASGLPPGSTVAGLTASNLLVFAVVLALPVLAIPALLRGSVEQELMYSAAAGLVLFAVTVGVGAVMLSTDRPLRWVGRAAQRVRNRLRPRAEPLKGLPTRLVHERDRILATLGPRWKRALAVSVGRWVLDLATLLAALAAIGAHPRPGLVLLAFCAAQLLAQIPVTPGGLGFVEAGLTAMLALAGVSPGDAVLATFAYRLFSYWLPLPLGLAGWALAPKASAQEA